MPRVTIICNSFPPETGGAPGRIYNLAKLLLQAGYEVNVITAMPNYPLGAIFPKYRGRLVVKEDIEGIRVKRIIVYPSNSKRNFPRAISMISHVLSLWLLAFPGLLFRRPDVTIVSSPPLLAAHTGMLLAKLTSKKVLLNVSDLWPLSAVEMGAIGKGGRFRFLQGIEKRMYRLADAFMGQSEEILAHIKSITKKEKPDFLYRNLQERKDVILTSGTGTRKTKKIIYAGLLGHAQGVLEICRGINFKELGSELVIYGSGPEKKALQQLVLQQPEKGITVCDTIPQQQLSEKLAACDATLIPLKHPIAGAVPSKLFLAIAHGLPVLFCAGGEGETVVKEYGLGWVSKPGDGQALIENIRALHLQDQLANQKMREGIRRAAQNAFDTKRQQEEFLNFFSRLLKP